MLPEHAAYHQAFTSYEMTLRSDDLRSPRRGRGILPLNYRARFFKNVPTEGVEPPTCDV